MAPTSGYDPSTSLASFDLAVTDAPVATTGLIAVSAASSASTAARLSSPLPESSSLMMRADEKSDIDAASAASSAGSCDSCDPVRSSRSAPLPQRPHRRLPTASLVASSAPLWRLGWEEREGGQE